MISENLPSRFEQCCKKFTFENEQQGLQMIKLIAERISSIYADFLTFDYHCNRNQQLAFSNFPENFPSPELVENFKRNLEEKIITILQKSPKYGFCHVTLSTSNGPEKLLLEVLTESDIKVESYQIYRLFPQKIYTDIDFFKEKKCIKIEMC